MSLFTLRSWSCSVGLILLSRSYSRRCGHHRWDLQRFLYESRKVCELTFHLLYTETLHIFEWRAKPLTYNLENRTLEECIKCISPAKYRRVPHYCGHNIAQRSNVSLYQMFTFRMGPAAAWAEVLLLLHLRHTFGMHHLLSPSHCRNKQLCVI